MQKNWQCRVAPSLGALESTHQKVWGTKEYKRTDNTPVVFFGMYGLKDVKEMVGATLFREVHVLWAGSDIRHLLNGYWFDDVGSFRIPPEHILPLLLKAKQHWVENKVEQQALVKVGIKAKVVPSYLGDVNKLKVTYKHNGMPSVYASVSGDDFKLYEWDVIERVAAKVPEVTFFLYGNTKPWKTKNKNVFVEGRVNKELMNKYTSMNQAGFRPLPFDGCSEIVVKAALRGQYVISKIDYPTIPAYKNEKDLIKQLKSLVNKKKPNLRSRNWFLKHLNRYPWVK